MKQWVRLAGALALTVVVAGAALAQDPPQRGQGRRQGGGGFGRGGGFGQGGPFGMMGGGLGLLRLPAVQQELKLTDPQIAKLDAKQDEVRSAMQELMQNAGGFQALRDMSPEERAKLQEKQQEIQDKAVADLLDANQLKRFKQLELQREGPLAANRKAVADALKLTDAQRKQVAEIVRQLTQERQELMRGAFSPGNPPDREAIQAIMQKGQGLQKAANEKVLALFTEPQKAAWKEMTGAPFNFPQGPPRPGV